MTMAFNILPFYTDREHYQYPNLERRPPAYVKFHRIYSVLGCTEYIPKAVLRLRDVI